MDVASIAASERYEIVEILRADVSSARVLISRGEREKASQKFLLFICSLHHLIKTYSPFSPLSHTGIDAAHCPKRNAEYCRNRVFAGQASLARQWSVLINILITCQSLRVVE